MLAENVMTPAKLEGKGSDLALNHSHDGQGDSDDVLRLWLELAGAGQRTAGATVRKFVDAVDRIAPLDTVGPAKQLEVISAALEMTQRMAHLPYDVGRSFVQSAVLVNVEVDVDVASQSPPK